MTLSAMLDARQEPLGLLEPVHGAHRRRGSWLARHPAWPVTLLLAGVPLWWALGLGDYMFILLAIPMAARLYAWSAHGNRKIRVPPGFGLWLLFLLVVVVGVATLAATAPGTLASPVTNRIISYSVRTAGYLADTALLLFAGNLTERELPRQRLAWLLGLVALYTIAGGLGGVFFAHFHFTSPLAAIVPGRLQANNLVLQQQLHPALAQLQSVLGTSGRPDAPFAYTNEWGNCLALLLPWLIARWWFGGTRRQRMIAVAGVVIGIIPIIYSLDRGLWIGLIFAVGYLGFRLAAQGRLAVLGGLVTALVLAAILIGVTPLQGMISQRLGNGASNARRGSLAVAATVDAVSSPLVGYGDTRHQQGSVQSLTVGRSTKCPTCGNGTIGGNGQLWLLLICDGFVGAALYIGFFAYGFWRYRRDTTPFGLAGVLVLLLTFIFMFSYTATGAPLGIAMFSYVMLWRNARARRQQAALAAGEPTSARGSPAAAPTMYRGDGLRTAARPPAAAPTMYRGDGLGTAAAPPAAAPTMYRGDGLGTAAAPPDARTHPGAGGAAARASGSTRLNDVARGGALNLAGAVIAAVTTLAVTVVITRHFSKPVAGAFFTAISLFLIAEAAASLGAYVGLVNFIARLRRLGHEARIPAILRAAVIPVVAVSVSVAAILILLARPLAHLLLSGHLGKAGASPEMVAVALRALAVALPFAALSDTLLGASRGYRVMRPTVVVDKIGRAGGQLIGVLIAISVGSFALLAPLWAVSYFAAAAVAWYWLRRIRRRQRPSPPASANRASVNGASVNGASVNGASVNGSSVNGSSAQRANAVTGGTGVGDATARGFWRFTGPRAVANLAQITIQRIDIVLVAVILGPAEAAIYTAATRFLVVGQFANTALNQSAQPRFAELFAVDDRQGANVIYRATTAWLIVLTWPLYLLAVIYGPEILSIFGQSYQAGHMVMIILGLTMLVATACGQVDMVLITTGRSSWSLANGLTALVVNVGLDLLLIPRYGITGAAIGWAAAIIVTNLTPLVQLAISKRLHPFGRGSLIAAGLAAASFAAIPLVARAALGAGAAASAGAVLAGCVVEAVGLWWFRDSLRLAALPGISRLGRAFSFRGGGSAPRQSRGD
jgi:O-antigen/teichoic acid export membrane protein